MANLSLKVARPGKSEHEPVSPRSSGSCVPTSVGPKTPATFAFSRGSEREHRRKKLGPGWPLPEAPLDYSGLLMWSRTERGDERRRRASAARAVVVWLGLGFWAASVTLPREAQAADSA